MGRRWLVETRAEGEAEMKGWFHNWNPWLTIPLIILYLIGILGFWAPMYVPPIAALARDGVSQEWLGFFGNIIGAIFTLLAAGIAWIAVRSQIKAQADIAAEARARKEFAARGILPLSLSSLHRYASGCIEALGNLAPPLGPGTVLELPSVPVQDVQEIRDALEHMENEPARHLVNTLHFLQIQNARLKGIEAQANQGTLQGYEIERRLFDALDLAILIDRSFIYARGADFVASHGTADELDTAVRIYGLNDAEPWIRAEVDRRRKNSLA